jgi:pilus assembly protein CpaB
VPVLVATGDLRAGKRVAARMLEVRKVPERFAPPDSLGAPEQALGQRLGAPVASGGYITHGVFAAPAGQDQEPGSAPLADGQRAIEIAVAGGQALATAPPGTRVDVLVTTDGRSFLALQDVELLAVRQPDGEPGDGAATRATAIATLRVRLREAVYLTAAESFARELRLLVRTPGDRRSAPALSVDGGDL